MTLKPPTDPDNEFITDSLEDRIPYSLVQAGVHIYDTAAQAIAGVDQSVLVNTAASYAETHGLKLVAGRGGHIRIDNQILFGDMAFDLSDIQVNVRFTYPLAQETAAVKLYHPGAVFANRVSARVLKLPRIVNAATTTPSRWFIATTLAADPGAAGVTLTLTSWPSGWPSSGNFQIRLSNAEVVLVTAGHGTTSLTVTRAQDDTTGIAHSIGAQAATSVSQKDIGLQLVNCEGCRIDIPRIQDFSVGLDEAGFTNAGHVYNTVRIGYLTQNRINHRQGQLDSTGWCNSNTYLAGSYGYFDDATYGLRLPGTRHVNQTLIDSFAYHVNGNVWYGSSFENRLTQYEVETGGSNNRWRDCRWEKSLSSPRVHYLDGAVLNVTDNSVTGGYGSDTIVTKYDTLADSPRNVIEATAGRRNNEIVVTPTDTTDYAVRIKRTGDGSGGARLLISKNGEHYWSTAGTLVFDTELRPYGTRTLLMSSPEGVSFTLEVRRGNDAQSLSLLKACKVDDTILSGISAAGDVYTSTIGVGFRTKEGTNAKQGVATLVAGTIVVGNTSVTANSRIFLTSNTDGGTPGFLRVSARTAGTSFTITSSNAADTSVVAWEIFEPGP